MTPLADVLSPQGPAAERIANLAWVMFGGGGAILVVVLVALGLALWGRVWPRRMLSAEPMIVAAGIVMPTILLAVLLAYSLLAMRDGAAAQPDPRAVRVEISAQQWWWRVTYVTPDGIRIASANEIRIPVAVPVEFRLGSADVIHSFWVPSLGGKMDMIPGRTNRLVLSAARAGIYRGVCAEYCGGSHALMAIELVAMEADAYAAWLAAEAAPAALVEGEAKRGGELFLAAGCGTCHTVRGTSGAGVIGPDLSKVGGRRKIAAATLPNDHAALMRFIADANHVKPQSGMPPFALLSQADRSAIATYLEGLR